MSALHAVTSGDRKWLLFAGEAWSTCLMSVCSMSKPSNEWKYVQKQAEMSGTVSEE